VSGFVLSSGEVAMNLSLKVRNDKAHVLAEDIVQNLV
jgi:hypothetical protein